MPRKALVLVNRSKPDAVAALGEVSSLISTRGRILATLDTNGDPLPESAREADIIVVLGGDGTLMSQSRRCAHLGAPLLGVNFGKLGFMAEWDLPSLKRHAAMLFDGAGGAPLPTQSRFMLETTVAGGANAPTRSAGAGRPETESPAGGPCHGGEPPAGGPCHGDGLALNDAVVTAGPPYRTITLSLRIDGQDGPAVIGDGLIVSTAIGSTAYNVSAGGPILHPSVEAMVITPIAAHSLSFRPIVVPAGAQVELVAEIVNSDGRGGGTTLVLDGQNSALLRAGDCITIRRHDAPIRLVRNPDSQYWATLINKMHWALPPRIRTRE